MAPDNLVQLHGTPVLVVPPEGPALRAGDDVLDIIADAIGRQADVVAVPVQRLAPEFFTLHTRLAGEIAQKFVNYRLRLVIVGDIAGHLAGHGSGSSSLAAFVAEANRGGPLWFVTSLAELANRLERAADAGPPR